MSSSNRRPEKKRHQCSVCQKRFCRPSALSTHMYTHTGERPFKCHIQGCGREFTVQSNLRRHLKVHLPSPAPRRRLSAQMRYQFLQEMMAKREQPAEKDESEHWRPQLPLPPPPPYQHTSSPPWNSPYIECNATALYKSG